MKVAWYRGLDDQQTRDIKSQYAGSPLLRRRLKHIIAGLVEDSVSSARSKLTYDSPNWALLQADQRGYERALVEISSYLNDDDKEKILPNK